MDATARAELLDDIRENGQMDEIIIYDDKILDGRNRYDICLELGIEPEFFQWDQLPFRQRGPSAFEYVMAHNFKRRQLTPSQKAAVAVLALPFAEAEAKKRQSGNLKRGADSPSAPRGADGNEFNQDTGSNPADESQAKGRAADIVAKRTGASSRGIQRAKRIHQSDPDAFEKVRTGQTTLVAAERGDGKREEERKHALDTASARVKAVCGEKVYEAFTAGDTSLSKKELLAFAAQDDSDMKKTQGLVGNGWTVARARKYKMTSLARTHSIGDLCTRALALGGRLSLEIEFQGRTIDISVLARPQATTI